jgi:hypothetical protein
MHINPYKNLILKRIRILKLIDERRFIPVPDALCKTTPALSLESFIKLYQQVIEELDV